MKLNKILSAVFMLFAVVCCTISSLMLYQFGTECFMRHIATISIGVGVAVLITWIGWKSVLTCSGSAVMLILGLSSLALLLESSHGCNAVLYIGDTPVITPGFFLIPAYIITMGYLRRIDCDLWMALVSTFACVIIPLFTLHSGVFRTIMVLACVLVPLTLTRQRWIGGLAVWGVAALFFLEPILVGNRGMDFLFDWERILCYSDALRSTPLWGAYAGTRVFKPLGGTYEDPVAVAFCSLGRWVIPVLIAILSLLVAAVIAVAWQKKIDWPRKILVIGSGIGMAFPMFACISRLYRPFRLGIYSAPFLSVGGASMVASFALLGLILAALNTEWRGARNAIVVSTHMERVLATLFVGFVLAGVCVVVYQDYNSQPSRIERMIPVAEEGFSYDRRGAVEMSDGSVWMPYRKVAGFGEPRVVRSIHNVRNGIVLSRHDITDDPPIVKARCRKLENGGVAVDCTDLFKREYTLTLSETEDVHE